MVIVLHYSPIDVSIVPLQPLQQGAARHGVQRAVDGSMRTHTPVSCPYVSRLSACKFASQISTVVFCYLSTNHYFLILFLIREIVTTCNSYFFLSFECVKYVTV